MKTFQKPLLIALASICAAGMSYADTSVTAALSSDNLSTYPQDQLPLPSITSVIIHKKSSVNVGYCASIAAIQWFVSDQLYQYACWDSNVIYNLPKDTKLNVGDHAVTLPGAVPYFSERNDNWSADIIYNGHLFSSTNSFSPEGYKQCNMMSPDQNTIIPITIFPADYNTDKSDERLLTKIVVGLRSGSCDIPLVDKGQVISAASSNGLAGANAAIPNADSPEKIAAKKKEIAAEQKAKKKKNSKNN